jgi:hypothetical protein
MMRLSTMMLGRVPSIQFRYGARVAAPAAGVAPTASAAAAQPVAPVILDSVWDLPAHLRPSIVSDEESVCLRLGGASDAPAKAAKGGKGKK